MYLTATAKGKQRDEVTQLDYFGAGYYDSDITRFLGVDPLASKYPWNSTYAFSENSTIAFLELEGLEKVYFANTGNEVDISEMNSETVKQIFDKNKVNFDSDWIDKNAKTEYWEVRAHKDFWQNSTGTTIEKYASQKSYKKSGSKPYLREWDRNFIEWLAAKDETLEGPDNWQNGVSLMFATAGVILSGGTLAAAESGTALLFSGATFLLSVDDLTKGPEGNTVLENVVGEIGGENAKNVLKGAKFALTIKDAAKGVANLTINLSSGAKIEGTYDLINDVFNVSNGSKEVVEKIKETKKGKN